MPLPSLSKGCALAAVGCVALGAAAAGVRAPGPPRAGPAAVAGAADGSKGCLRCHAGIEAMHPEAGLSCVDCHGGDASAPSKLEAHVQPTGSAPVDESIASLTEDLAWRRFENPMDLRVAETTCGGCHVGAVESLRKSLHGTTAGHLSDGFYEMGLVEERVSRYAVFPERGADRSSGELESLIQVPAFQSELPGDELPTHYLDLARKECLQCHLWSKGRALRGRAGFDGDYRGEGCAACHVRYAIDGLSESADPTVGLNEPGHPARHELMRAPSTQACTSCHYGDASIGLSFRGLSQLPPGAPGGPEIPGTTDRLLNRVFYVDDPELTPPDVHHERGMHCIDCHTQNDVMGDGRMVGAMEHAVEISCSDCHGTFDAPATLVTARGTPLEHLERDGEDVVLVSKVTRKRHRVPQAVHVLDPRRPEHNPRAMAAMTPEHADVECYTCHSGWNANFLGFHFDRNATLTQLDLLSGRRTPGRVTTQEKVFTTWKSFYAGRNERGAVAPYLTGFSTMGSVTDEEGVRILEQVLPETAAGLSGMTMIHHQLHSTRPTARSCVECHRAPPTWGLGSANFRLARVLAFVADRRGIEIVALNRAALAASTPLAKIVQPDVTCLEILSDHVQGSARYLFAGEGGRGVHVFNVRDPARPRRVAFVETVGPRGMHLAGTVLYLADGAGGLRSFNVSRPERPLELGRLPMFEASDLRVSWPWAYVADGPAGLCVVDVRAPIAMRVLATLGWRLGEAPASAIAVETLFQYSRPLADDDGNPIDERAPARNLCALLDEAHGLVLVNVTEPTAPALLYPAAEDPGRSRARGQSASFRGLVLQSHVDLAERQGGRRTAERDYAYVLVERGDANRASFLEVWDLGDPTRPRNVARTRAGSSTEMLVPASFYNPPFLQKVAFAPGEDGVLAMDVTVSAEPDQVGALPAIGQAYAVAVESFPLDRMLDEQGRRLKDVSHDVSRWLLLPEIERVLSVPAAALAGSATARAPGEESAGAEGRTTAAPVLAADPLATARAVFARLDADGSGFLESPEAARIGGMSADRDGDELLSLGEVGELGGTALVRSSAPPSPAPFLATRVGVDGDLARLFDGIRPSDHDGDGDGRLDRAEVRLALFAALDLDRDGAVSRAELSRHPGELRWLRLGGARAERLFAELDLDGDRALSPREVLLRDEEWLALDADGDGGVQLELRADPDLARRGLSPKAREWPTRQPDRIALPPLVTVERMLAMFDADHDGKLSRRELKARPDLVHRLDGDGSGTVETAELEQAAAFVVNGGVDVLPDDFVERWDLDRDGAVGEHELELAPSLRARLRTGR